MTSLWGKFEKGGKREEKWDALLASLEGRSIYQSSDWGKVKSGGRWNVQYIESKISADAPPTMALILFRKLPLGYTIVWVPGGPAGSLSSLDEEFVAYLKEVTHSRRVYIRIYPNHEFSMGGEKILRQYGWKRARKTLSRGMTLHLSLQKPVEELKRDLSRNWRRNLTRGQKKDLIVEKWDEPAPEEIMGIYREMEEYKGLGTMNLTKDIIPALQVFKNKILIYRCRNNEGKVLSLRGVIPLGNNVWDFLAATSPAGRKVYASHVTCWETILGARSLGMENYDFSGVDPEGNPGVYNFKRGTGAKSFQYLGEWERSDSFLLPFIVNALIKRGL